MPTYGYQCTRCNEQFEVFQRITEDALTIHEDCGGELRKLVYPVGIMFKGPGFYVNDYARNGNGKSSTSTNGSSPDKAEKPAASTDAAPAKTETPAAKTSEAKPAETKTPAAASK